MTSDLQLLINSLTGVEKAYINKLSKRHSREGSPMHFKLLKELEGGKLEPDSYYIQKFGIKNQPQFSMIKKKLLEEITDCVLFIYRTKPPFSNNDNLTNSVQFLSLRQVYGLAIYKAESVLKDESLNLKQKRNILYLLRNCYRFTGKLELASKIDEQLDETEKLLIIESNFINIWRRILQVRNSDNLRISKEEIKSVVKEVYKINITDPIFKCTPLLVLYYKAINAFEAYFSQDYARLRDSLVDVKQLWQNNRFLIIDNMELFLETANISFYGYFLMNDMEMVAESLQAYQTIIDGFQSQTLEKYWELLKFNTNLKLLHKTANYEELHHFLQQQDHITGFIHKFLPDAEKLSFLSSIAISHFVLGNFEVADTMLYEVKEINHRVKRLDITYFANLFHLVIVYELGDNYRLSNLLQTTYNHLYNKKQLKPFERSIILFLKKQTYSMTKEKQKEEFQKILHTLEEYLNDPLAKTYFLYFNYHSWLLSKYNDISYQEQIKRNLEATKLAATT